MQAFGHEAESLAAFDEVNGRLQSVSLKAIFLSLIHIFPFLVLAGHSAQWRDLNWLFYISCTIIKNLSLIHI